jgi:internalin A
MHMTTLATALLLASVAVGCDETKDEKAVPEAAASAPLLPTATATPSAPPSVAPSAPAATWKKRNASDCKPRAATVDFGDDAALEAEVRRKLGKATGPIAPSDLAQIKSINLAAAKTHQIDPCIFPMLTGVHDIFLGPGEYEDLTPLQKLTTLRSLGLSRSTVKDLHAIEGLKQLDRLDLSHTLIGDDELKTVGTLVNLTELFLDEDTITDLTPIANLKKLERLSLKKSGVKSLAPLSQLKTLKFLYIADTPITDITPVQPLTATGLKLIQN